VFKGKLPGGLRKKREEVTKALPYGLTCGNLLFCTGIFKSKCKLTVSDGFFPGRFDISGFISLIWM
jgi:hypothetical protein